MFVWPLPADQSRMTLSTLFTIMRIMLIPIIVYAMLNHMWGITSILFLCAALTDLLDGWLARFYNDHTFLGACLDPIADKLLIISCFFTLAFVQSPLFVVPSWFLYIVLIKELLIIVGASVLVLTGLTSAIRPTMLGKITTVIQMTGIMWLFVCYYMHWILVNMYWVIFSILLFVILLSLLQYGVIAICMILKKSE